MSKGKMFKIGKNAISLRVSDSWYEVVDGTRCYQHASITHRIKEDILIISAVLLFFKVSLFFRLKNPSNAKNEGLTAPERTL